MAKKSLLRETETTTEIVAKPSNILAMPSAFKNPIGVPATLEISGGRSAYVVFAHPMSAKLWPKIQARYPSAKEGDTFLCNGASIHSLKPFEFFLVSATQYFVEEDNKGEPILASLHGDRSNKSMYEQIESVLLVKLNNGEMIPARHTFKGARCPAARLACETIQVADTPDWPAMSDAHRATLVIPDPRFRFTISVTTSHDVSYSTGRKYLSAHGTVRPTTSEEYAAITTFFSNEHSSQICDDMIFDYNERVADIKALMS